MRACVRDCVCVSARARPRPQQPRAHLASCTHAPPPRCLPPSLSLLTNQVEILRRLRADPENLRLRDALLLTINGIAGGMRNSG